MKVVLYGASGRAGSRILSELVRRGHPVVAVARSAGAPSPAEGVMVAIDDLSDVSHTAEVIAGAEAVISAYAPPAENQQELVAVTRRLVEAVGKGGVARFLMVGGAGSLEVAPGVTLLDSGKLPPDWVGIAKAHSDALEVLRASTIDWTSLSPAIYFDPGERTGSFRLGNDDLIMDSAGDSRISMEDFAIAMVDELEQPRYRKQRFSIGY
jgi:putative NADH-flavin reductase